jgi:hypothetical protein
MWARGQLSCELSKTHFAATDRSLQDDFTKRGIAMKLVDRKTKKAIRKSLAKVIKKQGPKIVASLASALASSLATLASTDAPGTHGKKSNLAKLLPKAADMLTGGDGEKSHRNGGSEKKDLKKQRGKKRAARPEQSEAAER